MTLFNIVVCILFIPLASGSCQDACGTKANPKYYCLVEEFCVTVLEYHFYSDGNYFNLPRYLRCQPHQSEHISISLYLPSVNVIVRTSLHSTCAKQYESFNRVPELFREIDGSKREDLELKNYWGQCRNPSHQCESYKSDNHTVTYQSSCSSSCPPTNKTKRDRFIKLLRQYMSPPAFGEATTARASPNKNAKSETIFPTVLYTTATPTVFGQKTANFSMFQETSARVSRKISAKSETTLPTMIQTIENAKVFEKSSQTTTLQPKTPEDENSSSSYWWIALVVIFVVAVIIEAAVLGYISYRKRKKRRERKIEDAVVKSAAVLEAAKPSKPQAKSSKSVKKTEPQNKKVSDQPAASSAVVPNPRKTVDKLVVVDPSERDRSIQTSDKPWDKLLRAIQEDPNALLGSQKTLSEKTQKR